MNVHRRLLALATVVAVALTACSGITIDGVRFQAGEDGITVSDEESELSLGLGLPADFPSVVPLYDGEIMSGASVSNEDGDGWAVQIVADQSGPEALRAAHDQLIAAGFAVEGESNFDELHQEQAFINVIVFTGHGYNVSVSVISHEDQDETLVNYGVTPINN